MSIIKTPAESFTRYHDFGAWLSGDTITSVSIKCFVWGTTTETTSAMIKNVAVATDPTQVVYTLYAGTSGLRYEIKIQATTVGSQIFEDDIMLYVNDANLN